MSSVSLDQVLGLDSKIGAAYVGNLAAAILYGVTCLQTFIYFKKEHKDSLLFRLVILLLWVLDTIHLAFITHAIYYYTITAYGNPVALLTPTWSILIQIIITISSDMIIRFIYGQRVWLVSGKSKIIAGLIALTSLLTFGTGFAFTVKAFILDSFSSFGSFSFLLYLSFGSALAADCFIAISLCVSLSRNRTGFRKSDTLVNTLMLYAINSGLLTTICAAACLITYAVWPSEFIFIGVYFTLSKLFLNSLLATLNGREGLQNKLAGLSVLSETGQHTRATFQSKHSHGDVPLNDIYTGQPVAKYKSGSPVLVAIDRRVEVNHMA